MRHRFFMMFGVTTCIVGLGTSVALWGCGEQDETVPASTSTTAERTAASGFPDTGVTAPPPAAPSAGGTTFPETTVLTGTTIPGAIPGSQTRTLTFVGLVGTDTWRAVREIVMSAADDGQRVLDGVATLAAGPPVEIPYGELEAVSGIGFTAGASSSQPVGVAVDDDGNEIMVFAYTVTGQPDLTTIVGFERGTNSVELVEGPLPISNSTENITTVPTP